MTGLPVIYDNVVSQVRRPFSLCDIDSCFFGNWTGVLNHRWRNCTQDFVPGPSGAEPITQLDAEQAAVGARRRPSSPLAPSLSILLAKNVSNELVIKAK